MKEPLGDCQGLLLVFHIRCILAIRIARGNTVKEIERYGDLFINREDAYATQRMDGSYICRKEEIIDKVLADHLKGRITCGWYCLNKSNQIKWACVDADSEDRLNLLRRVSQRLKELGIPSYIE